MHLDEAMLARAEALALLVGIVETAACRVVDRPWTVLRAEDKLLQLSAARTCGAVTPETIITNSPEIAGEFMAGGAIVAKSVSSGPGLAPYVDLVTPDILPLLPRAPVLLQREIRATADLRVVTVSESAFWWRRPKPATEAPDWRRSDPGGEGFEPCPEPESRASELAYQIASALGLTFSVQDWLQGEHGLTFLEVNPQGQWIFLVGSPTIVAPALAEHLVRDG